MTRERRVGIFVTVGLVIVTMAIFLIGQNRKFWQRKVRYQAVYSQVSGLKAGSPVAMGGVDVGVVGEVRYSEDPGDPKTEKR
jgi:phospholipid/cholesterol/gamma-HCH transport system substrate-binding protein